MTAPFPRAQNWRPGDHVSASQLIGWDRCSAAYWFERVMRIPTFDRAFFLIGSELHKIAQIQLTAKRDKLPILSMTQIADLITADLNVRFSVPGVKFAEGETAAICIEDTICMAELYMKSVFPKIEPFTIEMPVGPDQGLRLPGTGTPVKAVLDVIDQYAGIRDLKTGKAKWPDGAADRKVQTLLYAWAFRVLYSTPPAYVAYDLIVRKKRGKKRTVPEAEYHEIKVQPDLRLEFGVLRRMEAIVDQMKTGHYFPNHSHECNDCSFRDFCDQHFTEQPFAPWAEQAAETQVVDGPKLIRVGGRNGHCVDGTRSTGEHVGDVQPATVGAHGNGDGDGPRDPAA